MENFDYESIFEDSTCTYIYDDVTGKKDEFYALIKSGFEAASFPNIRVTQKEIITTMKFFGSDGVDSREMVLIELIDSPNLNYHIFFSAQTMGSVVMYSHMECMKKGMRSIMAHRSDKEIRAAVRSQVANLAEYEMFTALDSLAHQVFDRVIKQLAPN